MKLTKKAALLTGGGLVTIGLILSSGINFTGVIAQAAVKTVKTTPDKLGPFNVKTGAPVLPTTTLTPQGSRGACWPSNTFNHEGAVPEVVNYLEGKDTRDKFATFKVVVARDTAWLSAFQNFYHYTPGETDAKWHEGLVLRQLTAPITVLDTYCPDGQQNVQQWQVQTLQPGEWVFFLKGHAPGDGTNIVPVRKANCGNFLLPPPAQPKVTKQHVAKKTPDKVAKKTSRRTPPPKCVKNCTPPPPKQCVKPPFPGNGWAYDAKTCTYYKVAQTKECMLNGGPNCPPNGGNQPVQHNPGQPIGATPGAPTTAPAPAPVGSTLIDGTRAPDPTVAGTDSGSQTGSGTPAGSTCDSSGCIGGGPAPGSGPTDTTHAADNNGVTAGTSGTSPVSTGTGTIVNLFG
jgi:hypothetical protein